MNQPQAAAWRLIDGELLAKVLGNSREILHKAFRILEDLVVDPLNGVSSYGPALFARKQKSVVNVSVAVRNSGGWVSLEAK